MSMRRCLEIPLDVAVLAVFLSFSLVFDRRGIE
jgi:hypothetical protein